VFDKVTRSSREQQSSSIYRKELWRNNTKSLGELAEVSLGRELILPKNIENEHVKYCIETDGSYVG
jgi:hypothetical protein